MHPPNRANEWAGMVCLPGRGIDKLNIMGDRVRGLESLLAELDRSLIDLGSAAERYPGMMKLRADTAAARFRMLRPADAPPIIAILGGTGTGKSTIVNRLLGQTVTAASVRRTFTSGPIAITADPQLLPPRWLNREHRLLDATQIPARGDSQALCVAITPSELASGRVIVDTPDLDGDQPAHHASADLVFRWADAVLFVVTPEKYQMTELLAYYRLAERYALPRLHLMNKTEEQAVVDDYQKQMRAERIYVVPRDDSGYSPSPEAGFEALKQELKAISVRNDEQASFARAGDLLGRLQDQVLEPMLADRREIDRLTGSLKAMQSPSPGVDVNPLTQQLQRRLQERSVLYLMGPGRVMDRVRQVPGMIARLPRTTWDLLRSGKTNGNGNGASRETPADQKLEFHSAVKDQFVLVQSRIDDILRASTRGLGWIEARNSEYAASKIDPASAGAIAEEEVTRLEKWLEEHWNSTPRDTAVVQKLLKLIPGGHKLTQWSEAAPYLLAIVVATHHAFFGPVDLMILGTFSLTTWLTEKLSNEVASRARAANDAISDRFTELTRRQIESTTAWLAQRAPTGRSIQSLSRIADRLAESIEASNQTIAGAAR